MKHLIDKEKFLAELDLNNSPGGVIYVHDVKCDMPGRILDALSKHTKDLPKKKEISARLVSGNNSELVEGYNQCLENCEGK